jgi:AraC-like DNA-binding protein
MLYEPTTLATVARLIGETLEKEYGIDPAPAFEQARIDTAKFRRPGSRVPLSKMTSLWDIAVYITHDQQFGLKVGSRAEPSDYYALGHAWLASATLAGGLERLCRYAHVLSTAIANVEVRREDDMVVFVESAHDPGVIVHRTADEAGIAGFFRLCEIVKREPVRPLKVELVFPPEAARDYLDDFLQCPVTYGNAIEKFYFSREEFDEPLPGYIPDVLDSTSRIAERYLETLDQSKVATDVRQLLLRMLPSGKADQDTVASRLYRSTSTLQRQLTAEGTNYRDILESTRRSLAEQYLKDGGYSQAEIAFMIGFSDQSNFARAFKRWTGMSPGQFQKAA